MKEFWMKAKLNFLRTGFTAFLILTTSSFLLEIIVSPYAGLLPDSRVLLLGLIFMLVAAKIFKFQIVPKPIFSFSNIILPILMVGSLVLLYLESLHSGNYVFIQYGLSYSRLFYLTLASTAVSFVATDFKSAGKLLRTAILLLPVYLLLGALMIFVRNHQLFRFLIAEDSVIEYTQTLLFLSSSAMSVLLAKRWFSKQRAVAFLFLLAGIGFFFVAGEEVSWGQRLLNIDTPEHIAAINTQNEITIHNHEKIFGYVYRTYMMIGLVGGTAWMALRLMKNKLRRNSLLVLSTLIPEWYLSGYFLTAFVYNLDRVYLRPRSGETLWEEPMELLLAVGIFLYYFVRQSQLRMLNRSID